MKHEDLLLELRAESIADLNKLRKRLGMPLIDEEAFEREYQRLKSDYIIERKVQFFCDLFGWDDVE